MAEDDDSKTEEPSERKLQKAREEGDVAVSQELKTWVMILGATIMMALMVPGMASRMTGTFTKFLEQPHAMPTDLDGLRQVIAGLLLDVGLAMALPLGLLMVFGMSGPLMQHGLMLTAKKIAPSWNKISPMAGAKRLFSSRSLMEFLKGLLKLTLVGAVAVAVVWPKTSDISTLAAMDLQAMLAYLHDLVIMLMAAVLMLVTVIAGIDLFYTRFEFRKKMRMTKQEVKDEYKQSEGDPMIKSRLRALRAERARQRMMQAVPQADVIVTNPTHYAVALKYDMETMPAPILVAKGVDLVAKRIRDLAEEHEIPLVENPPLARALYAAVELDQEIPPEHYRAVAEIIGYVMRLKGKLVR